MSAYSSASLNFADEPKLELDELIDQLIARAQGVKQAQGRLRQLLRAIELVTGNPGFEQVLRHAAEAACALTSARYGALGVIAPDGGLEQFIHVGLDDDAVAQIGRLPEGKGLLGALITDPRPIRLPHIADDARSSGFPSGHPPMDSFLGVPIVVRGEVFGNLYLTESLSGKFSAEDEELVRALAVTVGTTISHARLYEDSQVQQRWLGASAEISAQLLAVAGEDPLQMIARRAAEIAAADLVTVGLLTADRADVLVEVAVGLGADDLLGQRFAVADSLGGRVVADGRPLLLSSDQVGAVPDLGTAIEAGPTMVIPLIGTGTVLGVLSIARCNGRAAFSRADLDMASSFASHASVALELAAARSDQQRVVLLEDRDRIARDLHDHVIQQLFAIGLSVESVATSIDAETGAAQKLGAAQKVGAAQKLHDRVADIDRTIRQIRTSIFELRGPVVGSVVSPRQTLLEIADTLALTLGFSPRLVFSGAIDVLLGGDVTGDVTACVREGLTNVAKHAKASSVDVDVIVTAASVTVMITDDGIGAAQAESSSGLANLRARAERRHGSFEVLTPPGGGTQLLWKAPIS